MRRGFTLVECMLAGAILGFLALVLFEGVIVATRIAHDNSELLAAEAIAWDATWKRFNEDFDKLAVGSEIEETLSEDSAPTLAIYDEAPVLTVKVQLADDTGFSASALSMKKIVADVEWGPTDRRRSLSDEGHAACVFRSRLGRVN